MRIFSSWHDYYDVVQKNQYDDNGAVWIRKERQASFDEVNHIVSMLDLKVCSVYSIYGKHNKPTDMTLINTCSRSWSGREIAIPSLVFIAGKIIPYFHIKLSPLINDLYVYTYEEIEQLNTKFNFYHSKISKLWLKDFMKERSLLKSDPWVFLKTPVFTVHIANNQWTEKRLQINCNSCLKDINFLKAMDPYTVWQEIDMYLNNQLTNEIDPGSIDDKYRLQQHGFDPKLSFRKMSERVTK